MDVDKVYTDVNIDSGLIINNRVLVPIRDIFEWFNVDVKWKSASDAIVATKGKTKIVIKVGSKTATVNGKAVSLDVAPRTIDGTTYVPLQNF